MSDTIDDSRLSIAARLSWVNISLLTQLVRPFLPEKPELDPALRAEVEQDVVEFVAGQIGGMPSYLRTPYQILLHVFNWMALLRFGCLLVKLDPRKQRRYLQIWTGSPISLMRDFVKLIRSCALLQYLDHTCIMAQLESSEAGNE